MNKPISSSPSASVRSRPLVSIEEIRGEKKNPPVPPQAVALMADPVPLEVRRLRVRNGSKRKRDLAAVRMADELELLERRRAEEAELRASGVEPDPCRELRAWVHARRRIRRSVPGSTYRLWIKPLRPTGSLGDTLFLSAPDDIRAWSERRYSSLIAETLEGTPFSRVSFAAAPIAGGEG